MIKLSIERAINHDEVISQVVKSNIIEVENLIVELKKALDGMLRGGTVSTFVGIAPNVIEDGKQYKSSDIIINQIVQLQIAVETFKDVLFNVGQ